MEVIGQHALITSDMYTSKPAVPTWNYAAVTIIGRCRHQTEQELDAALDTMIARFQPALSDDPEVLPPELKKSLMRAIRGIHIEITSIHGKLKLGQHKRQADQFSVFEHLRRKDQNAYVDFAQNWLERFRPSVLKNE